MRSCATGAPVSAVTCTYGCRAVWNTCLLNLLPKYSLLNLLPKLEHRYRQYLVHSCLEYLPTEFITEVQPTKFITEEYSLLNLVPVVQPY
eukprot:SAG31_NODE_1292_length_8967_cov_2.998985_11_plen_90_part_00